ncbi:hypothetical protein [Wolbachia endosymbiont (group A) of Anomoia purmunda]|uniref:hypothetical protein n=1 Tax=Wolbachia endosymbiont (group A) of Anomoia purmunda TaxID=2953978 RepID=UPI00222F4824|nr:hypothetical protein [Wolbachia endosymbiont (group A) of Anomoia purmunda]
MSSFISEGEKNPIVTLRAQAEKFDYKALRAKAKTEKGLHEISSGLLAFKDINRMDFVINGKSISRDLIAELYKEHDSLLPKSEGENEDYRPFARKVFKEMFKYAGAQVPSDHILEELVINCNQAGYESIYSPFIAELLGKHELFMNVNGSNVDRKVYIDCRNPNSVKVECKTSRIPVNLSTEKISDMSFSLEFTLQSQDEKDNVTYKDGKLLLTAPKRLKDYNIGDKNLFDIIRECFQKLCEKFGFFKIKIGHNFDKQLKVNSHLEGVESPVHSNEHGNAPGN